MSFAPGALSAARRDVAHGALGADAAPGDGARRALRGSGARDRDDRHGAELLVDSGACEASKVRVVPHGAPARLTARAARVLDGPVSPRLSRRDRRLPALDVRAHLTGQGPGNGDRGVARDRRASSRPYVIAGRTHPDIAHREGEQYRLMLERVCSSWASAITSSSTTVSSPSTSFSDMLAATDVFLTPYRNREQIASGALTFAISRVRRLDAVLVRTGHAGHGSRPSCRSRIQRRSPMPCRYSTSCEARRSAGRGAAHRLHARLAVGGRGDGVGAAGGARPSAASPAGRCRGPPPDEPPERPLLPSSTTSASCSTRTGSSPIATAGTASSTTSPPSSRSSSPVAARSGRGRRCCTVTRLLACHRGGRHAQLHGLRPSLARRAAHGRPRRSLRLGARWILATAWIPALVGPAQDLLDRLVGAVAGDVSLRTAAYTVLGLSRLDADRLDPRAATSCSGSSTSSRTPTSARRRRGGRWFEDELTYDNARLSQALIIGGHALDRPELTDIGLESLRWLGDQCGLDGDGLRARPPRAA